MIYSKDILAEQWHIFSGALRLGLILGLCYDFFRAVGLFLPNKKYIIAIYDAVFTLWAGFLSFSFLLNENYGVPRFYIYFGEGIGFLLWYFSFGRMNYFIAKKLKKILCRVFGFIFKPLKKLFTEIVGKIRINAGNLLKKVSSLMYNKLCLNGKKAFLHCGKKTGKEREVFEKECSAESNSSCLRSISAVFADKNTEQNQ